MCLNASPRVVERTFACTRTAVLCYLPQKGVFSSATGGKGDDEMVKNAWHLAWPHVKRWLVDCLRGCVTSRSPFAHDDPAMAAWLYGRPSLRLSEAGDRIASAGRFNRVSAAPQSPPCHRCRPLPSTTTTDHDLVDDRKTRTGRYTFFRTESGCIVSSESSRRGASVPALLVPYIISSVPLVPKSVRALQDPDLLDTHTPSAQG